MPAKVRKVPTWNVAKIRSDATKATRDGQNPTKLEDGTVVWDDGTVLDPNGILKLPDQTYLANGAESFSFTSPAMTAEKLAIIAQYKGIDMDILHYDKRNKILTPRNYHNELSQQAKDNFSEHPLIRTLQNKEETSIEDILNELPKLLGDEIAREKVRYIDGRGFSVPQMTAHNKHGDLIVCGGNADILIVRAKWSGQRLFLWANVMGIVEVKHVAQKSGKGKATMHKKTRVQVYAQTMAIADHCMVGRDRIVTIVLDETNAMSIITYGYRTRKDEEEGKKMFFTTKCNSIEHAMDYVTAHINGLKHKRVGRANSKN